MYTPPTNSFWRQLGFIAKEAHSRRCTLQPHWVARHKGGHFVAATSTRTRTHATPLPSSARSAMPPPVENSRKRNRTVVGPKDGAHEISPSEPCWHKTRGIVTPVGKPVTDEGKLEVTLENGEVKAVMAFNLTPVRVYSDYELMRLQTILNNEQVAVANSLKAPSQDVDVVPSKRARQEKTPGEPTPSTIAKLRARPPPTPAAPNARGVRMQSAAASCASTLSARPAHSPACSRRLEADINEAEEAELRRLEAGVSPCLQSHPTPLMLSLTRTGSLMGCAVVPTARLPREQARRLATSAHTAGSAGIVFSDAHTCTAALRCIMDRIRMHVQCEAYVANRTRASYFSAAVMPRSGWRTTD